MSMMKTRCQLVDMVQNTLSPKRESGTHSKCAHQVVTGPRFGWRGWTGFDDSWNHQNLKITKNPKNGEKWPSKAAPLWGGGGLLNNTKIGGILVKPSGSSWTHFPACKSAFFVFFQKKWWNSLIFMIFTIFTFLTFEWLTSSKTRRRRRNTCLSGVRHHIVLWQHCIAAAWQVLHERSRMDDVDEIIVHHQQRQEKILVSPRWWQEYFSVACIHSAWKDVGPKNFRALTRVRPRKLCEGHAYKNFSKLRRKKILFFQRVREIIFIVDARFIDEQTKKIISPPTICPLTFSKFSSIDSFAHDDDPALWNSQVV